MQLLEKTDCFGKVIVTRDEDEKLQYVLQKIKEYNRAIFKSSDYMPQEFKDAMHCLFPAFYNPEEIYAYDCFGICKDKQPIADEVQIKCYIDLAGKKYWATLLIQKENGMNEYYMLVYFDRYLVTCVDELVKVIGNCERKQRNHCIEPVEKIPPNCRFSDYFGIFDVPNLSRIFGCYEAAKDLLGRSAEIVGASLDEINALRSDSLEHKNIVIRKESKKEYDRLLQRLAGTASIPVQDTLSENTASNDNVKLEDLLDVWHIVERFRRLDMRD